ncbi:8994_t:CDS:2 [Entrophospora sp. SA101]|nr:3112_t:CDS:2 [Entrophospora sp. SA101]CAJ0633567.1 8994_t:CDS:2 [Entrophospora sp. SA101]CAJ0843378.1 14048_t:CDS:2 [Entrophospora sp. SA101]CAJ0904001.1 1248_t:CDS:2 [Entrophospora sp. SA101]
MSLVDETSFVSQFLETLSTRQVKYPKDFSPPTQTRPRPITPSAPTSSKSSKSTGKGNEIINDSSAQDTPIQVSVKSLKGNLTHNVQINNSETIYNLKEKLQKITSFTPSNQRLILKGKALIDTKTLFEHGITNGTVVHLVHKPGITNSGGGDGGGISKNVDSQQQKQRELAVKDTQLSNSGIDKIKDSQFWVSLRKLLVEQFPETNDADNVLKDFFNCYNNKDLNINVNLEDLINKNS